MSATALNDIRRFTRNLSATERRYRLVMLRELRDCEARHELTIWRHRESPAFQTAGEIAARRIYRLGLKLGVLHDADKPEWVRDWGKA